MYATDYFEEHILNTFRGITFVAPASVYLGLFITPVDDAGNGTEISYQGYIRKPITFTAPAAESGGIGVSNDAELKFAQAQADSGTVTHIGIFDSVTAGNMLLFGALEEVKKIVTGDAPTIRSGEIKYWLTGNMSTQFKTRVLGVLRGTNLQGFTPHITLYNGNPEVSGAEITGGNFGRVPITFSAPSEGAGGSTIIENSIDVDLAVATQNLGVYDYDAIFDGASLGIPVVYRQSVPDSYGKGDMVTYSAGYIKVGVN